MTFVGVTRRRPLLRRTALAFAVGVPPFYVWYASTSGDYYLEGAMRGIYFWARAGPIVARYVYADKVSTRGLPAAERDAVFERLHAAHAPTALSIILALRGFYVKVGQFASGRADITPRAYIEEFRQLQDEMPFEDVRVVRATISACLGREASEVFAEIEPTPLGAASIGQVHKAKLRSSGEEVVVKVQYPHVKRSFYTDMSCIRWVVTLVEPSLEPVLGELRKQFLTEFDYRGEAKNLTDVARVVMPLWGRRVAIPEPLLEFSGEHVLTMTRLPGEKLETVLRREWKRLGFDEADMRMRMEGGRAPPSSWAMKLGLRVLRWCAVLVDCWDVLRHKFARSVPEQRIPDRTQLLRTLLDVHAQGVLQDGVFNADLHPGNFLLLPDGRLGLIDFGQVKRIDATTRRRLATLMIALADGNRDGTVEAFAALGVKSKKMDARFLEANARLLFGRMDRELTEGKPLTEWLRELRTWDTLTEMPGELYLPARAAMMLRGLAMLLHCEVSIAEEWRPAAERTLRDMSFADACPKAASVE